MRNFTVCHSRVPIKRGVARGGNPGFHNGSPFSWGQVWIPVFTGMTILLFFCPTSAFETKNLVIHTPSQKLNVSVEVADSPHERSIGLMYRKELLANSGMLFIFPEEEEHSFWMKNTLISLDILFIDKKNTIVFIAEKTTPFSESLITSIIPSSYVLEVNAGYVQEHGIKIGQKIDMPLDIPL